MFIKEFLNLSPLADPLLLHTFMINRKQLDNLAKYCYDISKLVIGLMVIGNLLSDRFSIYTFWIGIGVALIFLVFGHLLDRLEECQDDKP